MARQPKPFILEIKTSRKPKEGAGKPLIWGNISLKPDGSNGEDVVPPARTTACSSPLDK